ncbi:hypothetical protein C8R46DRAFT_923624 [Mycena filopes]|nr:hypothetical protein C8R46DRAFT_923624 [Mycena filopes]
MFLFFLFSLALAAPFHGRSVFDPPITSPTAESVWKVGDVETVTWQVHSPLTLYSSSSHTDFRDATGIPAGVTGRIMLGFLSSTSEGEHLSVTLASGFNLTDAKVDVTVPPVVSGTEYIIVLFGDSGTCVPSSPHSLPYS